MSVCNWCDKIATGTAEWPREAKRYPSCGEHLHGIHYQEGART